MAEQRTAALEADTESAAEPNEGAPREAPLPAEAVVRPATNEATNGAPTLPETDGPSLQTTRRLPLSPATLSGRIEALLFVSTSPLSARALAKELSVEAREIREAIHSIQEQSEGRGIIPVEVAGGYQLRTKAEHAALLREYLKAKPARLSKAALETLAIIAYRQPITRVEAEDIRGVDCGAVLKGLLERRLVKILGRKEEVGRPILYGTSPQFLELFALKSLRELPTLRDFVELSEEHQRILDRDAPLPEEVAQREVESYLAELHEEEDQEVDDAELELLGGLGDEGEGS